MGYVADKAYAYNHSSKTKETPEERNYRLSLTYNRISSSIEEKVTDARSYVQMRNTINAYAHEAGKNSADVIRLRTKLNKQVKKLETQLNDRIRELNQEIEEIKNDRFEESVEKLQELDVQVEHRTLQMLMQLGNGNRDGGTGIRRKLGNIIAHADRADALALMKIASLPQFAECFSAKQRQIIVEKSKNPAEVVFEKNKEPLLSEKGAELGKAYLKSMSLRNILKKISNEENAHYFVNNAEEG